MTMLMANQVRSVLLTSIAIRHVMLVELFPLGELQMRNFMPHAHGWGKDCGQREGIACPNFEDKEVDQTYDDSMCRL